MKNEWNVWARGVLWVEGGSVKHSCRFSFSTQGVKFTVAWTKTILFKWKLVKRKKTLNQALSVLENNKRMKNEQPSSPWWWWDKMGIKIFSTINKCFFISYMEIKLFSIAVAMQKNKWVKQWDVAEIVIAIRLSGLQMAPPFVCLVAPCVLTCMLNWDNNAMSA